MSPYETPSVSFVSMETYNHGYHDFMRRVAWNCDDHIVPCVKLHRSLMNADPDT